MEANEIEKDMNNEDLQMEVDQETVLISNYKVKNDNAVVPMNDDTELKENGYKVFQEGPPKITSCNVTKKDLMPLTAPLTLTEYSIALPNQSGTSELSSSTAKDVINTTEKIKTDTVLDSKEMHDTLENNSIIEPNVSLNIRELDTSINGSSSQEKISLSKSDESLTSKNVLPILDSVLIKPMNSSHSTSDAPLSNTVTSDDEKCINNNLHITPTDAIFIQKDTTLSLTDMQIDTTVSHKEESPIDITVSHKEESPKDITNPSKNLTPSLTNATSNSSSEMSPIRMDVSATIGNSFIKSSDVFQAKEDTPQDTPFMSASRLPYSIPGSDKYKCQKCNYVCGDFEEYKNHLDSHISSNSVSDFTSANLFDEDEDDDDICIVDEHINTNQSFKPSERQKMCDTCNCTFVLKHLDSLKVQILIYKNINMSPCGKCMEKYRQINNYHQSMQFGRGSNSFSCIYCDFQCNVSEDLQTHMHIHEAEELEVAPQIEGQFSFQYDNFDSEYDSSLESQMFQPNSWQPMDSWRPQIEILPIQGTYGCPHCDYRTNYMNYLKHHLLTHNDERPYACPYCNYKAKLSKTLKHHISRHTGEKPFACPYCEYRAIQKTSMIEHVRTHTGERPHQCPLCPYTAINGRLLKKHIQTKHGSNKSRTANRSYTCSHCDFITKYKSELKSHLKQMHKAETPVKEKRPFACPHCSYRAQSGQSLTHHIYTHTGEKPYACPHCDYRARQKKTLNLHIQTHTGEKRHHCPHCDYAAIYKSCLKLHIVKKHPGMAQPKDQTDPTQHFLSDV